MAIGTAPRDAALKLAVEVFVTAGSGINGANGGGWIIAIGIAHTASVDADA